MGESHLVLVHGACHGAWCWYKVASLLKASGHKVTALDLGASGVNPKQITDVRSLSDYNQPLMDFMEALPPGKRVILVGHSLGTLSLTIAMEAFPHKISVAVFAGASPDSSSSSPNAEILNGIDFMDSEYGYDDGPDNPPTSILLGPNCLATWYYQLSPPEDFMLGQLLVRPCPLLSETVTVTKENYGSVHRIYIMGDQDLVVQNWSNQSQNNLTEVKLISGADHMIMFSRPLELCSYLQDIANKYT